ncbi:MAG: MFS transporter [Thermoanaerobaculia bacterium]|nr:MFS transporter [Thermoanaerobaculia bacterium]
MNTLLPRQEPGRSILLPCLLLFGAMFNLTLVVAGLKELIIEELGGSLADAGLFFSVETFAYLIFAPVWGVVSDRAGVRKPFIIAGFAGSALIYGLYGLVESVPLLLGMRFLQGAVTVMGWSLVMAIVVDHPRFGRVGRYMGLMGASLIFGVALGAPMGGYITRWAGARAPLTAAAVSFVVLTLAALALREPSEHRRRTRLGEIAAALAARPRLLLPLGFHFVDRLAVGLFVVVFPLYLDSLGAEDPAVRGRYLSFFLLPFALLQYFTGRLSERSGPYLPLLVGSALYGALLATVGYTGTDLLWAVMLGLGILASVMFPPAILLTSSLSDPRSRGSAVGGFNLAGSLGFAVGPIFGTWAYGEGGFALAFLLCGAAEVLLAMVGVLIVLRWRARDGAAADATPVPFPGEAAAAATVAGGEPDELAAGGKRPRGG